MAFTVWSVVFGEIPTAAKWNQLGENDVELRDRITNGWTTGLPTPDTVTYNGNGSYTMVFNAVDLTDDVSEGYRLRSTRTVTAPTQCTDLESGSTQYYTKSSPAGTTFTDDFTLMGWVKLESYTGGLQTIISRYDGTQGWLLFLNAVGSPTIQGGTGGNNDVAVAYQSVPLGRWVHVAASLDMSGTTAVIYMNGASVPLAYTNGSASTTAQAGVLQVGASNGTSFPFDGKLAQVAVFSSVLSAATIRSYQTQGLAGNEATLVSAYSFNNSIADLNTTNANNLTAVNSAVATNVDSPFAVGAGTYDYGIVMTKAFATNTTLVVQAPEGCTFPTSGGITALASSPARAPYGFPAQKNKWVLEAIHKATQTISLGAISTWYTTNQAFTAPIGEWNLSVKAHPEFADSSASATNGRFALATSTSALEDKLLIRTAHSSGTTYSVIQVRMEDDITLAAAATYSFYVYRENNSGAITTNTNILNVGATTIKAVNNYL